MVKRRTLFVLVTDFDPVDGEKKTYVEKELETKEGMDQKNFWVKFFHHKFQTKLSLVKTISPSIKETDVHVVFQKGVPPKKMEKLIQCLKENFEEYDFEKITFYSTLN